MTKKALIVVDEQKDFCEGGSLAVEGGNAICVATAEHLMQVSNDKSVIIAFTKDWHSPDSDNGGHIALPPAEPDFTDTWPPHCIRSTSGADFHPAIAHWLAPRHVQPPVFKKGQGYPSYSGFEGIWSPTKRMDERMVTLADYLNSQGVKEVDVVGIAADYCVRATAMDAVAYGFKVNVIADLTVGIHKSGEAVREELLAEQAKILR